MRRFTKRTLKQPRCAPVAASPADQGVVLHRHRGAVSAAERREVLVAAEAAEGERGPVQEQLVALHLAEAKMRRMRKTS